MLRDLDPLALRAVRDTLAGMYRQPPAPTMAEMETEAGRRGYAVAEAKYDVIKALTVALRDAGSKPLNEEDGN